jgi:hypothetical protein
MVSHSRKYRDTHTHSLIWTSKCGLVIYKQAHPLHRHTYVKKSKGGVEKMGGGIHMMMKGSVHPEILPQSQVSIFTKLRALKSPIKKTFIHFDP